MKTRKSTRVKAGPSRRLEAIEGRLRRAHGQPRHHNPQEPLDDLVFIVLSRMTQEVKYVRTYEALRRDLPSWGAVMEAPAIQLEALLADAGLARTKSRQIKALLEEIESREGELDLRRLRRLPDDGVEAYLTSLPGVARKTARCVMLYTLGRDACPVDTHVWRVLQRLGIAQGGAWTEARARAAEEAIPKQLRSSLHVTLLAHGRSICRARHPLCQKCCIADLCPAARGQERRGARLPPAGQS